MKNPILVWVYKFLKEKKKVLKKIEEHQATQSGNTLTWSCHKFHFDQVIHFMMIYTFTHLFHIVVKLSICGWTIGLFNISFTNSEYTFCLYISGLCSLWQRCIFLINFDIFLKKMLWIVYFSSSFQWRSYSLKTGNDVVAFQRGQYSRNWFHPFFWPSPRHIQHLFSNICIFPI